MKHVFLYVRVSTEEQAVHGLSIEAQTAALRSWAEAHECMVVGVYTDAGISARKPARNRPELQRLLQDVEEGKGELILFTKLDRWFRNISEYYKVQEVLEKHNVNWKTIQEDYDTTTASGRLKVNIMLSVAQDEADRTGERIKFVHQDKVLRGEVISGKVPLGYKIENKKMAINPETAPMAQDIFKQYAILRSIRALRGYIFERYGKAYAHTSLKVLLTNERYIGHAHGQDDFCPALIDPELFGLCQDLVKERGQRNLAKTSRVYLFTGLVRCAECGNKLSAHVVHNKYIYYRCTRNEKLHLCPHKKRTNEQNLEKWLLENLISSYEEYNFSLQQQAKASRQNIDIDRIKRKMEKLKDLYLNDLIDRDSYEKDYIFLRDELRKVNAYEGEQRKPVDVSNLSTVLDLYHSLSRSEKKELWNRLIGHITITNNDEFFVSPVRHK